MHAHVDEDAAAVGTERRAGRVLIPLEAREQVDLAQLAGFDAPAERLERRHIAPPVRHLERDPVPIHRLLGNADLGGREPAGLLAQDRQSRRRDLLDDLDVAVARGGDEHAVDAAGVEQLGDVLEHGPARSRDGLAHGRHGFYDRRHADRRRAGEGAEVRLTHAAGADQPEAELAAAHSPRSARKARFARWSEAARSNRSRVLGSVSCSTTSQPR